MKEEAIFIDKIKVAFLVLRKEADMIEVYCGLIKGINKGIILLDNLDAWSEYAGSWNIAHELFCFLEYNKISKLETRKKKKDEKKEDLARLRKNIQELREIMKGYEAPNINVTFEQLQKVVPTLREIVSLSGYHKDTLKEKKFGSLFDEET